MAGRRQTHTSHDAQPVSLLRQAVPPSGLGAPTAGWAGAACEEAGCRLRELTDLKRRRLPRLRLPSMLSVFSACCSVFSFSSLINLKQNKTCHLPLLAEEHVWTRNLGWNSVSQLANSRNSCSSNISAKSLTFPLLNILKLRITQH